MNESKNKKRIRDAKTETEIKPVAQPGYYPGFSTLQQKPHWDAATRKTVIKRIGPIKPLQFFSQTEAKILQAVLDCVMPQSDRDEDHQIPLLSFIDERMHAKRFDGYIFEGSVEDDVAHQMGLRAIEAIALSRYQKSFCELSSPQQETILLSLSNGTPGPTWQYGDVLPPKQYWSILVNDAVSAYYAHPFAWDEIGFGGPAYPRGYMRLTGGLAEPWEKDEVRYEWLAPEDSLSEETKMNQSLFSESSSAKHGQSGTH
jgi:hypothetical protein